MNPFRLVRKYLRLTQHEIPGLSKSTILKIEAGHYEELSEGMISALVECVEQRGVSFEEIANDLNDRYGTPYLSEAYQRWRTYQRKSFGDQAQWPDLKGLVGHKESPMEKFVTELSGTFHQFCKDLCIQYPTVYRYAQGQFTYIDPPMALRKALEQARYAEREQLFNLQRKWINER